MSWPHTAQKSGTMGSLDSQRGHEAVERRLGLICCAFVISSCDLVERVEGEKPLTSGVGAHKLRTTRQWLDNARPAGRRCVVPTFNTLDTQKKVSDSSRWLQLPLSLNEFERMRDNGFDPRGGTLLGSEYFDGEATTWEVVVGIDMK
uniref:Uncharacterized protein n=1 Tax=Peronospora matthiolae TaxID=2874970 RepID=A0AAV1VHH0_9STRA